MVSRASEAGANGPGDDVRDGINVDVLDSINVVVSSRLPHDSFSRRGKSPAARSSVSPAAASRALSHRPSPLILPPAPQSGFGFEARNREHEHNRDQRDESNQVRDNRSSTPGGDTSQLERKRSVPLDSAIVSGRARSTSHQDEEDADHHLPVQHNSDDEARGTRFGVLAINTPSSTDIPHRDSICFCVRAPKVPRPRNAFILYRQHYQSQVVADNPGLANPDISKIIGRMWKEQPDDVKSGWKQLAEEDKLRHRIQHPGYRYQPRRAGKKGAGNGGRPASEARSGETGDGVGGVDPNRCEKCGGRHLAPLPSARSIPGSARTSHTPSSPFGLTRSNPLSSSQEAFEVDEDRSSGPFPSPGLMSQTQSSVSGHRSSSREAIGRRPLPQHGRPGTLNMGLRGYQQDEDLPTPSSDQKRRRYDPPTPYPSRFSPYVSGDGSAHPSYRIPRRSHHYSSSSPPPPLPHSAALSQFASSGPAPSPASPWMGPPPLPLRQSVRGYASHSLSHGREYQGEPATPGSEHAVRADTYGGMSARLPPLQGTYGYYQVLGSGGGSAIATPSTAMAGLSMRLTPPPTVVAPAFARITAAGGNSRERHHYHQQQQHQQQPRPTSGFTDESLKLPPLKTDVPLALQAAARQRFSDSSMTNGNPSSSAQGAVAASRLVYTPSKNNGPVSSRSAVAAAHIQDMYKFAVSPKPTAKTDHDDTFIDQDSQASGIRAMVMSVSYLGKLEVLRRISPPQPMPHKRGPIIAIEGHNTALIEAVGRIVERALIQSSECNVGIWAMASSDDEETDSGTVNAGHANDFFTEKQSTDSGMGSSIHGGGAGIESGMAPSPASGDDYYSGSSNGNSNDAIRNESSSSPSDPLAAYLQLIMSLHEKSRAILQHITSAGGRSAASIFSGQAATMTAEATAAPKRRGTAGTISATPLPAAPPSPAKSPLMMQYSPTSPSPATRMMGVVGASETAAANGSSKSTANSSAPASPRHSTYPLSSTPLSPRVLPVAIITGGYSLAISDKYAMTVPIDDAYPPIGHWEWMATMWRGIAGPDLVVYADAKPPLASTTSSPDTVDTKAQDGVIIVHVPPTQVATRKKRGDTDDDDGNANDAGSGSWAADSVVDKKTERRLTFELMEWVRSGNFGGI